MTQETLKLIKKIAKHHLSKYKISAKNFEIIFSNLYSSHLLGHQAHGLHRLKMLIKGLESGSYTSNTKIKIIKNSSNFVTCDGEDGIGLCLAQQLMKQAVKKAKRGGISIVTAKRCGDLARLGSHFQHHIDQKMIGIIMATDSGANPVVALGSIPIPFFSTNPIAAYIPKISTPGILMDFSTSSIAIGKLKQAINASAPLSENLLLDRNCNSVSNPQLFFENPTSYAISSLGYPATPHKGFALSLLVECLAGALSDSSTASGQSNVHDTNAVTIITIAPEVLWPPTQVSTRIEKLCSDLKQICGDEIHIPGEKLPSDDNLHDLEIVLKDLEDLK